MNPTIGICAAIEVVRWGAWEETVTMAPHNYARAVRDGGGVAFLLPPDERAVRSPELILDRIDALLLAGGADLDPSSYGAEPHPKTVGTWPERDRFELALTRAAIDRGMPVLGICRGMQLLNVALGGSLIQDLPEVIEDELHRNTPGAFGDHEVRLEPGSLAARAVGAESAQIKSHHHQGVDRLGEGLVASGWSSADEVIEAIEVPASDFALGVLWHPEEDVESNVVGALISGTSASFRPGSQPRTRGSEAEDVRVYAEGET